MIWEGDEESKQTTKKISGVYVFNDSDVGEEINKNSVLWKSHFYTINFSHSFICKSCLKVKTQFVDLIYDLLKTGFKQPVYGKL